MDNSVKAGGSWPPENAESPWSFASSRNQQATSGVSSRSIPGDDQPHESTIATAAVGKSTATILANVVH